MMIDSCIGVINSAFFYPALVLGGAIIGVLLRLKMGLGGISRKSGNPCVLGVIFCHVGVLFFLIPQVITGNFLYMLLFYPLAVALDIISLFLIILWIGEDSLFRQILCLIIVAGWFLAYCMDSNPLLFKLLVLCGLLPFPPAKEKWEKLQKIL